MSKFSSLASEIRTMHKPDKMHHHPRVEKGKHTGFWYTKCVCGYLQIFSSWKRAMISAMSHSTEIQP